MGRTHVWVLREPKIYGFLLFEMEMIWRSLLAEIINRVVFGSLSLMKNGGKDFQSGGEYERVEVIAVAVGTVRENGDFG